jgi:hypothetical protein
VKTSATAKRTPPDRGKNQNSIGMDSTPTAKGGPPGDGGQVLSGPTLMSPGTDGGPSDAPALTGAALAIVSGSGQAQKRTGPTRLIQSDLTSFKKATPGSHNKRDHSDISPSKKSTLSRSQGSGGRGLDGGAVKKGRVSSGEDYTRMNGRECMDLTTSEGSGQGTEVIPRALVFLDSGAASGTVGATGLMVDGETDLCKEAAEDDGVGLGLL